MITIIISPHPSCGKNEIEEWRSGHENIKVVDKLDDVSVEGVSLFQESQESFEVHLDSFLAQEVRDFSKFIGDQCDVLILSKNSSRASFSKDKLIQVLDFSLPKDKTKLKNHIVKNTRLSKEQAGLCVDISSSSLSALLLADQLDLLDGQDHPPGSLIDPLKNKDQPPWELIDSICSGDTGHAVMASKNLIGMGADATSLMFQICGYMRKVIVSQNDVGNFIGDGKKSFFNRKYRAIKDINGLVNDLSFYPDKIMGANKSNRNSVFVAAIISMTDKF